MCQLLFLGVVVFAGVAGLRGASAVHAQTRAVRDVLGLADDPASVRSNIVDTFDCSGRQYGYYADPDNGCQVFHICYPSIQVDGSVQMFKWSFLCPTQTVFNQETLTCTRAEDAVPCQDVSSFYFVNDSFGQVDQPFSRNEI